MKHEADSQVLQRVQAGERLLGHRADLVPLQKSGKTTKKKKSVSELALCLISSASHKSHAVQFETSCYTDHELTVF